jgi:hypothetical protein
VAGAHIFSNGSRPCFDRFRFCGNLSRQDFISAFLLAAAFSWLASNFSSMMFAFASAFS